MRGSGRFVVGGLRQTVECVHSVFGWGSYRGNAEVVVLLRPLVVLEGYKPSRNFTAPTMTSHFKRSLAGSALSGAMSG